jgi:proteic killer suppression protein
VLPAQGGEAVFDTVSTAGIQAQHAARLGTMLTFLNAASAPQDMNLPGWTLHPLKGSLSGH